MHLLNYAILPRISVQFLPQRSAILPQHIMFYLAPGLRMDEMHHVTYMYCPCLNQNCVKM